MSGHVAAGSTSRPPFGDGRLPGGGGKLDEVADVGGEARELLDLAETKAIAGMALRRRLAEAGFDVPAAQRTTV